VFRQLLECLFEAELETFSLQRYIAPTYVAYITLDVQTADLAYYILQRNIHDDETVE
jgi:hypothetical protein